MRHLLLLAALAAPGWGQEAAIPGPPEPIITVIPGFECGLVTNFASHLIQDGCLQEAENVVFGRDYGVSKRKGRSNFSTAEICSSNVRRLYNFVAADGTRRVVALCGDGLYEAESDGVFAVVAGSTGLPTGLATDCVAGLAKLWCVNLVNGLFFWDGTSTGTVSGAPRAGLVDIFRNRLILADVSGARSSLYLSGYLDGEDWTIGTKSTSPAIIQLKGANDGDRIKCLMGTHQDAFIIGTEFNLYALYGFSNSSFELRERSREAGCLYDSTVQERDGELLWLSRRGVEKMVGPQIDWTAGDNVRNVVDGIVSAAAEERLATDTSQADFQAGNLTASGVGAPISATISAGSLVPSSWTAVDTSSSDFAAATNQTNVSTNVTGSVNIFQQGHAGFINNGMESQTYATNWTELNGSACTSSTCGSMIIDLTAPQFGLAEAEVNAACGSSVTTRILDSSNVTLLSSSAYLTNGMTAVSHTFDLSTLTVSMIKVSFDTNGAGVRSVAFVRGSSFTYNVTDGNSGGSCNMTWDSPQNSSYVSSGTFLSQCFDTVFSTPTWGLFSASVSSDTNSGLSFRVQAASSCSGVWDSLASQTLDSVIAGHNGKRYGRYEGAFTLNSTTNTPAAINSATLNATTTGYFISQCRSPGANISSWGLFQCNFTNNGGSFSFAIATGTTCGAATATNATWTAQTNNTAISIATGAFVSYRVLFDLDVGTETPTLNDCTINWTEGGGAPEPASAVFEHSYHLFFTTNSTVGAVNSHALVLDYRNRWSQWSAMPITSAVVYNRQFLAGSNSVVGRVYKLYDTYADAGASIVSKVRTKDYDGGDWTRLKSPISAFVEVLGSTVSADNADLTFNVYRDVANYHALGSVSTSRTGSQVGQGVVNHLLRMPAGTISSGGTYFGLALTNTSTKPWTWYRGIFLSYPIQRR